ncbi:MAG: tRNA threonylcarbamoyladenosine dehydratase [Deltaproteobacteria bacterium]|nr:tRNA threonylcarbamoyladenosine dehydratase [Deltaproteobacteria bacterium]
MNAFKKLKMFDRLKLLTGDAGLDALENCKVILFGVGGVGSWCAESLIRSGIGSLTLVDNDTVCETNINRQLQATHSSIGSVKVEALKSRLQDINSHAEIITVNSVYNRNTAENFDLSSYNYVIDAIDSLTPKVELITRALSSNTILFSSSGAAGKLDPARIKVASIWKVEKCPLAKKVKKRLKKDRVKGNFLTVYSDELLDGYKDNSGDNLTGFNMPQPDREAMIDKKGITKKQIGGSVAHITAIFGFFLAGLVFEDILKKSGYIKLERGVDNSKI